MWEFEEALKILKDMCEGLPDLNYEFMDENVIKKEDRILLSNVEDVLKLLQDKNPNNKHIAMVFPCIKNISISFQTFL